MTKKMSKADKAMLTAVIVIAVLAGGYFATRQGIPLGSLFVIVIVIIGIVAIWYIGIKAIRNNYKND